jgi:hypothetical protein
MHMRKRNGSQPRNKKQIYRVDHCATGIESAGMTAEKGDGAFTRHGLEEHLADCGIFLDHLAARRAALLADLEDLERSSLIEPSHERVARIAELKHRKRI